MKFSTQVGNDNVSWSALKSIALEVDKGSWHTLYNYDHLVPPSAELMPHLTDDRRAFEEKDCLEGYSILSAWAALTERVRIGCLVTAMPFRNPALLAKQAATIDHISNGRFEFGLGAAWHESEARAYGIDLGTPKERLDRFNEGLEVIRRLLDNDPHQSFQGHYFRIEDAPFAPRPVQKKLPILIGGGGEKRTLRMVAEYADHYNFFIGSFSTKEAYAHKNRVLDEHCQAIGRDPKEIRRSVCFFTDIVDDEAQAKGRRDFMGSNVDEAARLDLLFGSPQFIIDGIARNVEGLDIDEVILCGLTPQAETFQRFNEEVLRAFAPAGVR
jgi:F420-dependent oxidoreductase-like protein